MLFVRAISRYPQVSTAAKSGHGMGQNETVLGGASTNSNAGST